MAKKLNEIQMTPEAMKAITEMQIERLGNLSALARHTQARTGQQADRVGMLLGELVMVEVKLDALMLMMEAKVADFERFPEFMQKAAEQGKAAAISIRRIFSGER